MSHLQLQEKRLRLQAKLEEILGSRNVYYQPPESVKLEYPAIIYTKKGIKIEFANNATYLTPCCYELMVVDKRPDNEVIGKLLQLPMCSFDRHFKVDNLNHDVLILYF